MASVITDANTVPMVDQNGNAIFPANQVNTMPAGGCGCMDDVAIGDKRYRRAMGWLLLGAVVLTIAIIVRTVKGK